MTTGAVSGSGHELQRCFATVGRELPETLIKRRQCTPPSGSKREQVGVGELTMALQPAYEVAQGVGKRHVVRPELMSWVEEVAPQQHQRIGGRQRVQGWR